MHDFNLDHFNPSQHMFLSVAEGVIKDATCRCAAARYIILTLNAHAPRAGRDLDVFGRKSLSV